MENVERTKQLLSVLEAHKGIIHRVSKAYSKNDDDQKDLMQEIAIQIWQSLHKYKPQYKLSTWIYRIALNVSISFYRKEHRRKQIANPISEALVCLVEESRADENEFQLAQLQKFIAELQELDRALILLYLEGMRQKEMAEILDITETNVSSKIGRIKSKLQKRFTSVKKV